MYYNECNPYDLFIRRKKKKPKVKSELSNGQDLKAVEDLVSKTDDKDKSVSGSNRNSPALAATSSSSHKTEAEKRFEEVQKRRVCYNATCLRFPRKLIYILSSLLNVSGSLLIKHTRTVSTSLILIWIPSANTMIFQR